MFYLYWRLVKTACLETLEVPKNSLFETYFSKRKYQIVTFFTTKIIKVVIKLLFFIFIIFQQNVMKF